MPEATVMVTEVTTKTGTSQSGRDWSLWNVIDGNGEKYATFDGSLGSMLDAFQGKRATLVYEDTDKGKNLKSIRVADAPKSVGGARDPGDPVQVMIVRQNSWSHATALTVAMVPPLGEAVSAKWLFEQAAPLAHMIELDVRRGYITEDEVPF